MRQVASAPEPGWRLRERLRRDGRGRAGGLGRGGRRRGRSVQQPDQFVAVQPAQPEDQERVAVELLAEQVVGTGEGWLTELSTAELRQVLALRPEAVGVWGADAPPSSKSEAPDPLRRRAKV